MHIRFIRTLLFALVMLSMSAATFAQIGISISFAPPELPVYEQPLCPGDGYLWTPGYWAYANDFDDYYWVPGTWVMAPEVGFLWTPAYWGWGGNGYVFYDGYWGPHVGFYGGISYGYGYYGEGYEGGRWDNGHFFYNRSVNNVNVTVIHNVYNTTVVNSTTVNRVSYNGGNGGISVRPRPEEEVAAREKHVPAVAVQTQHAQAARTNPEQRASVNHGTPAVAATPKPGAFGDRAVVPAKAAGAPYNPPDKRAPVQPVANAPVAHPENNVARPAQPNNQPEANRPPTAQPNTRPEPSRPEPNRPTAQPSPRPEPNRVEPAPRPQTPPPSERSPSPRTSPPAEARPAPQQQPHPQPAAQKAEEKKQAEPPKREEKPPQ
jgi:WXXGXW repeat (2 copies)